MITAINAYVLTLPRSIPEFIADGGFATNGSSSNPVNVPWPNGVSENDIAILEILLWDSTGANGINTPSGFTQIHNATISGGTTDAHGLFWKRCTGSESGTVNITSTAGHGATDTFGGVISIWRGCAITGTPFEGYDSKTGTSAAPTGTAVHATGINRLVCNFCANGGSATSTAAASWSEEFDYQTTSGSADGSLHSFTKEKALSGWEGPATHTLAASQTWSVVSLALLPVNGEVVTPPAAWSATLTVGSGETTSDLTNYPLYVDLADMPAGFWANTNEGKDLRASIGGTQVPVDVVWCSVAEQEGAAFIKVPTLATASSTVIDLEGDGVSELLADTHTYGRNAVWADYHSVFLMGMTGGIDRTGRAQAAVLGDPNLFELAETSSTDLNSHQGICWDGTHYYTTDDNAIYKWNSSWSQVDSNTDPIGDAAVGGSPTVNHCGDPCVQDGLLYIPLECYPASGGLYNAHIVVFDAATLNFVTSFDISTQAHEASSIAYCDRDGLLYVTDFDGNFNKLWKYDPADGSYEGQLVLSRSIQSMQGITWWRDRFWISQDLNDETILCDYSGNCSVDYGAGTGGGIGFGSGTAGNYEGIGHRDDGLIQHIDPGATERAEVWTPLKVAKAAQGGATFGGVSAEALIAGGRSSFTTFTLGATANHAAKTANHVIVSYTDETITGGTNTRTTLAYRHANTTFAVWDSANSWLNASPIVNPTVGTSYRVHAVYNGTTNRKLYVDGVLKNTSGAISAAPTADAIFIGVDDTDYAEPMNGKVGFVYLRASILSDAWLAAEYSNLNSPSGFYSIA